MERTKVESSQIEAIGYDPAEAVLEVEFKGKKSHSVYRYYKVDAVTADDFLKAESKGIFLGQKIKGKFEFQKIEVIEKKVESEGAVEARGEK